MDSRSAKIFNIILTLYDSDPARALTFAQSTDRNLVISTISNFNKVKMRSSVISAACYLSMITPCILAYLWTGGRGIGLTAALLPVPGLILVLLVGQHLNALDFGSRLIIAMSGEPESFAWMANEAKWTRGARGVRYVQLYNLYIDQMISMLEFERSTSKGTNRVLLQSARSQLSWLSSLRFDKTSDSERKLLGTLGKLEFSS